MADPLGLTDYAKEMAQWNKPYVYREFPKMLYLGRTAGTGRVEVEQRIVGSEAEEAEALHAGWDTHPQHAQDAETRRQEAIGTAAAERAAADRRLSRAAQAEAEVADQAAGAKHLGEIPETPRRPRPTKETPKTEPA